MCIFFSLSVNHPLEKIRPTVKQTESTIVVPLYQNDRKKMGVYPLIKKSQNHQGRSLLQMLYDGPDAKLPV